MPASPEDLFAYLDRLGLDHETRWHEATFTVDEGRDLKEAMPGGHTKNLFMKDKDGVIVLIAAHAESELKLNQLHKLIGTRRLSFASGELMEELLGVTPGSVTAFSLINDTENKVQFIVDAALMPFETLNFHPLVNTGTTAISRSDFKRFVDATGHDLTIVDFAALLPDG
ncbi:prolyl-tRNA synthetase associated domain-containing protein [Henriciella marina]|uniref:prolyl-tRNA synthetase associated domain-containing protein n=1 Tax=Henriciella marina TaxID=453851 RepID=UPI0003667A49|nr:prolyl-tRNA synthetase associated domain-containing protein [Henriciella marina]